MNINQFVSINIELLKLLKENIATIQTKKAIVFNIIENLQELDKDLDELQERISKTPRNRTQENRYLTEDERIKLYKEASILGISQAYIATINHTSKSLINLVFKGRYKVSPLIINHFLNAGIDLNKIMKGEN